VNFARDSLVAMALVLHRVAESGQALSALAGAYDAFQVAKRQRHCPPDQVRLVLRRAREAWAHRPRDLRDGVKVRLEEGWFILRGSNTEPILRVIAEAGAAAAARGLAERVMADVASWLGETT
jgi:phosphomannomutase